MTTVYLYEDNSGGLHAHKDQGPIWALGTCGSLTGPDLGVFREGATGIQPSPAAPTPPKGLTK